MFGFGQLIDILKKSPKKIVFTEGNDPRILEAASRLLASNFLHPILVGNEEEILSRHNNYTEFISCTYSDKKIAMEDKKNEIYEKLALVEKEGLSIKETLMKVFGEFSDNLDYLSENIDEILANNKEESSINTTTEGQYQIVYSVSYLGKKETYRKTVTIKNNKPDIPTP